MVPRYSIGLSWRDLLTAWRVSRAGTGPSGLELWQSLGFDEHRLKWTFNGRTALRLVLRAAGILPGEPVVVPRLTCEQVHRAIISEGGRLRFVDIRLGEFAPTAADYAIAQSASGARFVVAVSYWGIPLDLAKLRASLPKSVRIIQDCALSFGSWHNGAQDGADADAAIFSFGPGKPLCLGFGGALVWRTNSFPDLELQLENLLLLPDPGRRAFQALLRTRLMAMVFNDTFAYRLARTYGSTRSSAGSSLTRDDSPLFGAPKWFGSHAARRWRAMEVVARIRTERLDLIRGLLADCECRFPSAKTAGVWNHWMIPFLLPVGVPALGVAAELARQGYETRSPYLDELTLDASRDLNLEQLPNWLLIPSLDILQGDKIVRFASVLRRTLGQKG